MADTAPKTNDDPGELIEKLLPVLAQLIGERRSESLRDVSERLDMIDFLIGQKEERKESEAPAVGAVGAVTRLVGEIATNTAPVESRLVLERSKYIKPFLRLLSREGLVRHNQAARALEIAPPQLTRVVEIMAESGLITHTDMGKYRYYELTDRGLATIERLPRDETMNRAAEKAAAQAARAVTRLGAGTSLEQVATDFGTELGLSEREAMDRVKTINRGLEIAQRTHNPPSAPVFEHPAGVAGTLKLDWLKPKRDED